MADSSEAVSNAGPLIHLSEVGGFELLQMFSRLYIPEQIHEDVCIEGMPGERELRAAGYIEVLKVSSEEREEVRKRLEVKLDEGEVAALALCRRLGDVVFLTDDLAAREVGKQLGLEVHGSAGVIARAYREGLIEWQRAKQSLERLYSVSNLFVTKAIIEEAMRELEAYSG
jgi:predicted nucleic acid-binding protein